MKDKIARLNPIDPSKYENMGIDHLVVFSVGRLDKMDVDLSFENIVVAAFKLFPKKFSLPGYPEYPAGKRIHDALWRCSDPKQKGWLGGKTAHGFSVTEKSEMIIKEAEDLISGVSPKAPRTKPKSRRRKDIIMSEVEKSSAYEQYIGGQKESISNGEFCFLLQGTLDSSKDILFANLNSLKVIASELEKEEILKFLDCLEEQFKELLEDKRGRGR